MIVFGSPLWLLLLGLLPGLRWLHRFQRQGHTQPVAALFLWRHLPQSQGMAGRDTTRPDPGWRLRALISALLILALADPLIRSDSGRPLEVWLDDSLSQFTREATGTRLRSGLSTLIERIKQDAPSAVLVHSLAEPTLHLRLTPDTQANWQATLGAWVPTPRGEPQPPTAALLRRHVRQIVLTDGADARLNAWLEQAPEVEILQRGSRQDNTLLSALAVRRPPTGSSIYQGLAELSNLGRAPISARLLLIQRGRETYARVIELPAEDSIRQHFSLALDPGADLVARLVVPDDPLSLDNELRLPLADATRPLQVATSGQCGPHLAALIAAHPGLEMSKAAEVAIVCGGGDAENPLPQLRLHGVQGRQRTPGSGHWHVEAMQHIDLPGGLGFTEPTTQSGGRTEPLWSVGERRLITENRSPLHRIDVYLDLQDPLIAETPQYPLLLSALLERLAGQPLSDGTLRSERPLEASRIAPRLSSRAAAVTAAADSSGQARRLAEPLLLLALLLMTAEVWREFGSRKERRR